MVPAVEPETMAVKPTLFSGATPETGPADRATARVGEGGGGGGVTTAPPSAVFKEEISEALKTRL